MAEMKIDKTRSDLLMKENLRGDFLLWSEAKFDAKMAEEMKKDDCTIHKSRLLFSQ